MSTKEAWLDWREGRRRRAWELAQQDWKQQDITAALKVRLGAVSQWLRRARERGVEALRRHPAPSRQPQLTQVGSALAQESPHTCRRHL